MTASPTEAAQMTPPLPPPRTPFPVRAPFKTGTDLYKLGRPLWGRPEESLFEFDDTFAATITEKLAVFRQSPAHSLLYLQDDWPALESVLWDIAAAAAADQPDYLVCDKRGFGSKLLGYRLARDGTLHFEEAHYSQLGRDCLNYLQTLDLKDRLCAALALSVQEDLVTMRNISGEDNADEAEALLVAIPSHWDPAEKLGQSFHDIHIPVGDNRRLLSSAPRLMQAMIEKGPFVRYNWSLASVPLLCQNPALLTDHAHTLEDPTLIGLPPHALLKRLYFRVERQTLLNFTERNRALFTIRIFQRPLLAALETEDYARTLADTVASMTPAHLEYRAMTDIVDDLVTALRTHRP